MRQVKKWGRTRKDWWRSVFNDNYLKTYIDITPQKLTNRQIKFLIKQLGLRRGMKILDLACGYGRHSIPLAKHGLYVTGIDQSLEFIALAKKNALSQGLDTSHISFIRGDIRNLPFKNQFDGIISMFTSFGYSIDENEHTQILKNTLRALKKNGLLVLDLNNSLKIITRIATRGKIEKKTGSIVDIPRKEKLSNGIAMKTKNIFVPKTMRWQMHISWTEKGKTRNYHTDTRIFIPVEIINMLKNTGFKIQATFGDFHGSSFQFDSPRLIIIAKK